MTRVAGCGMSQGRGHSCTEVLGEDVESRLLARGWAVTNLAVADSEPLEWFWPPTAAIGHGGVPESSDVTMPCRAGMHVPRQTPWKRPTRISRAGSAWLVTFGEAIAQEPDAPRKYEDAEAWASAVRTARAGGENWGTNGPRA